MPQQTIFIVKAKTVSKEANLWAEYSEVELLAAVLTTCFLSTFTSVRHITVLQLFINMYAYVCTYIRLSLPMLRFHYINT